MDVEKLAGVAMSDVDDVIEEVNKHRLPLARCHFKLGHHRHF